MNITDLEAHVAHFRGRVLQDALTEATAAYWRRRAESFDAAMPRAGDYTGRATGHDLDEQRLRLATTALACRQRSVFMLGGEVE